MGMRQQNRLDGQTMALLHQVHLGQHLTNHLHPSRDIQIYPILSILSDMGNGPVQIHLDCFQSHHCLNPPTEMVGLGMHLLHCW